MRTIVDGVLYDTAEMEEIGADVRGDRDDRRALADAYQSETLYLAEGGAFILACEGGSESRYAEEYISGVWIGGSTMTVLTAAEAREWCEQHLTVERYLEIAERIGWTVRRPGEDVREVAGRGYIRAMGSSSLVVIVTKEAKVLGLERGDDVEYAIRKVSETRGAERWRRAGA